MNSLTQPRLVRRAIAWIEILGYSNALLRPSSARRACLLLGILKSEKTRIDLNGSQIGLRSAWFSDTLIITAQPQDHCLLARRTHSAFQRIISSSAGVLARGSISIGLVYESHDYIVGLGIVRAQRLEQAAKWPVVAVQPKLLRKRFMHPIVRRRRLAFIDPLAEAQEVSGFDQTWRECANSGILRFAGSKHRSVGHKYKWMERYLRWSLKNRPRSSTTDP